MEPQTITFLVVLVTGILWNLNVWIREKLRPKRLAIVEDNDDDFKLLKYFCDFDNVVIDRYKTADNLPIEFAKNKPDVVIADYYLEGKIKGSELIKLCDKFRIPARLVTGYDGDIIGVEPERIMRKSPDKEYFKALQDWALHQLA